VLRVLLVTATFAGTVHRSNNWVTFSRQEHLRAYQRLGEHMYLSTAAYGLTQACLQSSSAAKDYLAARGVNPIVK